MILSFFSLTWKSYLKKLNPSPNYPFNPQTKQLDWTNHWERALGEGNPALAKGETQALPKASQLNSRTAKTVTGHKDIQLTDFRGWTILFCCVGSCCLRMQMSCLGKPGAVWPPCQSPTRAPGPRGLHREEGQKWGWDHWRGERERQSVWASRTRQPPAPETADGTREALLEGSSRFPQRIL